MDFKERVTNSFSTYAAMTIQHRSLIDARDALKPVHRMTFYAQTLKGITPDKPRKKTHSSIVASMEKFYVHGDASLADTLSRLARPITMRYCLEDGKGNMGTYTELDNYAHPRYTEMRLSNIGGAMVKGIKQDAIDVWFDNFDNTDKFPSVLPSLGYYNIVNGTCGIAVGMGSSIPQFNLREVNEAMIKLLWNPDISFDEIYCAPDFATGGTILNADEVKESLRTGNGKSAIIRGSVEYDDANRLLHITEVPYAVATGNIKKQIAFLFTEEAPPGACAGIERFNDSSEEIVDFDVYLSKGAIPQNVVRNLYKYTNLQYHYPINMVMLDMGKKPKLFSWKEALNAHLDHEKIVRTRIHNYEIRRIDERLPIVEAICLALANVDEVVALIRGSKSTTEAKAKLIERFKYNDAQAKAIVDIKLGKLANLEIQSFNDEKEQLVKDRAYHVSALEDNTILYKEIENDLREVAEKYGDERRTRLMNLDYKGEAEVAEPIEKQELLIHYTNLGNIYTQVSSTLMARKRGGNGLKVKMKPNETIVQTLSDDNLSSLLVFTNKGQMYTVAISDLPVDAKINISSLFEFETGEEVTTITSLSRRDQIEYFVFVTKNGMVKKTAASEYQKKRGKSLKAINLNDGDEVVSVHFLNKEPIGILTFNGNFVIINTEDINPIGRATAGIRGIKLNDGDYVKSSQVINGSYLITATAAGLVKKSSLSEFPICSKGIKGKKISGIKDNDNVINFLTLKDDSDIIIISNKGLIKFNTSELRVLSREATGVKAMNLPDGTKVVDIVES